MASKSVTCELSFPARRQLQSAVQTAIDDPSTDAFQLRLRAAVAASLRPAADESNVLVSLTSADRVLHVTIIGFESDSHTAEPKAVVIDMGSTRFLADVETRLSSSVVMRIAPSVAMRVTPTPSPPPTSPPSPTSSPSTPINDVANHLGAYSNDVDDGRLSSAMIWVICAAVVSLLVLLGCLVAYCLGKRWDNKTAIVGRPAIRRQVSPEEHASSDPFSPYGSITVTRTEDVRIAAQPSSMAPSSTANIAKRLDGVEAALNNVRASLSHADKNPTRHVVDARMSASTSIHDKV